MSQREVVTWVCDMCGAEDTSGTEVETQRITVGGHTVEAEVCPTCWSGVIGQFASWAKVGRRVPSKSRIPKAVDWPGTDWQFTHHALQRMGERKLTPLDVLKTIERPQITRPGRASDQEIRVRYGVKVVLVPERHTVLTVAATDEEDLSMVV